MQVAQGGVSYTLIDPVELRSRLARGESFTILDMRSNERYLASGETIAGAVRLAPEDFVRRRSEVPRGKTPVLVVEPERADELASWLVRDQGFSDVYVIEGGLAAFRQAGGGLVRIGR
jgi:rhodanese-related sulfurtransferase